MGDDVGARNFKRPISVHVPGRIRETLIIWGKRWRGREAQLLVERTKVVNDIVVKEQRQEFGKKRLKAREGDPCASVVTIRTGRISHLWVGFLVELEIFPGIKV